MSSKCNCPEPPGGGANCPSNNLAICRSENGKCETYCRVVPENLTATEALNWQINIIKDENRSLIQELTSDDYKFLSGGTYSFINPGGNEVVISFSTPKFGLGLK